MKIKVIDLLVKIANGEKVPKKIKFRHSIWEYCKDGSTQDYINDYDKCLMEFLAINKDGLNQDVEIIEEPKKIEKLETYKEKEGEDYFANILKLSPNSECEIDVALSITIDKLNELIDEINNLKEK